jgi:hypothetical protein
MHGMEALAALHRISGNATVLQRLLELLDILCSRLVREQGLLYEAYLPAAAGAQWQPAPGQVMLYGKQLDQEAACVLLEHPEADCSVGYVIKTVIQDLLTNAANCRTPARLLCHAALQTTSCST